MQDLSYDFLHSIHLSFRFSFLQSEPQGFRIKNLLQAGKYVMTILWHIRALLLWRSGEDTVAVSVYTIVKETGTGTTQKLATSKIHILQPALLCKVKQFRSRFLFKTRTPWEGEVLIYRRFHLRGVVFDVIQHTQLHGQKYIEILFGRQTMKFQVASPEASLTNTVFYGSKCDILLWYLHGPITK